MPVSRLVLVLIVLRALVIPAVAAEPPRNACLDLVEQRAAVASHRAVQLAQAMRTLRAQGRRGEVVRATLCNGGAGLVYMLTLLDHTGKVTRVTVDASNGALMSGR